VDDELRPYERVIDLFLAGRLPGMNHARHVAVGNLMRRLPHGHALMHLGLQVTAIRAGVPEKYSREVTDACWEALDGALPPVSAFADVL
jgi:hypothetical protein